MLTGESKFDGEVKLRVEFSHGALSMGKEQDELTRGVPGLALRDVRRNRNSGSAHLRDESNFSSEGNALVIV